MLQQVITQQVLTGEAHSFFDVVVVLVVALVILLLHCGKHVSPFFDLHSSYRVNVSVYTVWLKSLIC